MDLQINQCENLEIFLLYCEAKHKIMTRPSIEKMNLNHIHETQSRKISLEKTVSSKVGTYVPEYFA